MAQVIVVGGGLSGLSAAHTVLERGGRVLVLDKSSFFGGNSTKATSGINGALTRTQIERGVKDSREAFLNDTNLSANKGKEGVPPSDLAVTLCYNSAPAVEWLQDRFDLDLSLLGQLGGHSFPRTHRGKERFPGMTITYALMERFEEIAKEHPERARAVTKARVDRLLAGPDGSVIGCEYVDKTGQRHTEHGPVILASGGYGADFTPNSLLSIHRPDLHNLPTTNGDHCTGDGIKIAQAIGAATVDMERVQVHPTGLVNPEEPDAKVKFLAAEALRGCGALLLDADGRRFCNELGRRDYVSGEMMKNKGPFRLVLNGAASREIEWHCKHYVGRGLMKHYDSGAEFARDCGFSLDTLKTTYNEYNNNARNNNCPYGKRFFTNAPFSVDDIFHVAIVTPVVHYTMGGLKVNAESKVFSETAPIPGLFAAGEVMGGVHGINRLGGSSLLDCVVYGRVSGDEASKYLFSHLAQGGAAGGPAGRASALLRQVAGESPISTTISQGGLTTTVTINPQSRQFNLDISWDGQGNVQQSSSQQSAPAAAAAPEPAAPVQQEMKEYTLAEVAQHNTEKDCWVIVNGQVLDVTEFLSEHPGGKKAILLFAGKDATEEFNMLHKPDVVEKYAPEAIIGTLKQ